MAPPAPPARDHIDQNAVPSVGVANLDRAFEAAVPVAAFGGVPWRTGGANRWSESVGCDQDSGEFEVRTGGKVVSTNIKNTQNQVVNRNY